MDRRTFIGLLAGGALVSPDPVARADAFRDAYFRSLGPRTTWYWTEGCWKPWPTPAGMTWGDALKPAGTLTITGEWLTNW